MKIGVQLVAIMAIMLEVFGCGCAHQPSESTSGDTRVAITVTEKGFEPAVVTIPAGQPVTLVVTRTTDRTCATELVMKSPAINEKLPLNTPVEIKLAPQSKGELTYACAMDMFKGTVKVR